MDVGAIQTAIATVSVVGFLIFFGSPTVIVLVLSAEAGRKKEHGTDNKSDKELLQGRAKALRGEDTLARYFVQAFTDKRAINSVYSLSMIYGGATLSDLISLAGESIPSTYMGVSLTSVALSLSEVLLIIAVAVTLYGIHRVKSGADKRLEAERADILKGVEDLK